MKNQAQNHDKNGGDTPLDSGGSGDGGIFSDCI
jgi:hypothetical protein